MSKRLRAKRHDLRPIIWTPPEPETDQAPKRPRAFYEVVLTERLVTRYLVDASSGRDALRRVEAGWQDAKVVRAERRVNERSAYIAGSTQERHGHDRS